MRIVLVVSDRKGFETVWSGAIRTPSYRAVLRAGLMGISQGTDAAVLVVAFAVMHLSGGMVMNHTP
jgi:hypothetical protein